MTRGTYAVFSGKDRTRNDTARMGCRQRRARNLAEDTRIDRRCPGTFDMEKNQIEGMETEEPDGEDLLDRAVAETIQNGGKVHAVEKERMPEKHADAAAILRY